MVNLWDGCSVYKQLNETKVDKNRLLLGLDKVYQTYMIHL